MRTHYILNCSLTRCCRLSVILYNKKVISMRRTPSYQHIGRGLKHNGCMTVMTANGARGRRLGNQAEEHSQAWQNAEYLEILDSCGVDRVI